jgi:hypothetical protein
MKPPAAHVSATERVEPLCASRAAIAEDAKLRYPSNNDRSHRARRAIGHPDLRTVAALAKNLA